MVKTGILLETGTNELEILEFFIDEDLEEGQPAEPCHFGVNVAKVMQVIESPDLTPAASAPHPCFLGTIPLRDHILPVLDLSVWLGMKRRRHEHEVVIVTEFSQTVTGFLVSGVTEIHRVGWREVAAPSGYLARLNTACLIGIVERSKRFIQLLDLESIIADLEPRGDQGTWKMTVRSDVSYAALVAEDSQTIRMMLRDNLERANFRPTLTGNGEEALTTLLKLKAQAESSGRPITDFLDIVISDIEMPQMDGFSLTKAIKEDPILHVLPVILYSSIITDELRHKGESVHADEQVAKPELDQMAGHAIRLIQARSGQARA